MAKTKTATTKKTATKTAKKAAAKPTATRSAETLNIRALELRKDGLSFRAMEEKMFGAAGSGTRAFNVFNRAVAAAKATTKERLGAFGRLADRVKAAAKTPTAKTAKAKTTKARGPAVRPVITKTAPNGARVIA